MIKALSAVKNIVENFLPDKYLYFKKKYININFFLWGMPQKNIGTYLLIGSPIELRLFNMEEALGDDVVKWFKDCYERYTAAKGFLNPYILQCTNCIIEPKSGWGIDKVRKKLIFNSLANNSWKQEYYPSYKNYTSQIKKVRTFKAIISIRMIRGGEDNYWHFLHDLLGQVILAEQQNLPKAAFLISKNLAGKTYFKSALEQSRHLRELSWVVQDTDEYIEAETVYFIQSGPHQPATFYGLTTLLEVPEPDNTKSRKIFLTRLNKRKRFIRNNQEIETLANKYGFEIIDTENLNFKQQIELFGQTRCLIGIHGAGLINSIFRKNAFLTVFELFPADYIPPHYFWLTKDMGHEYLCQTGSAMDKEGGFYLDPFIFEQKIKELLSK